MKNEVLVINGGMGFIGSQITEKLLVDNEVTIINNESTERLESIKYLLRNTNLTFIQGSFVDLDLAEIFQRRLCLPPCNHPLYAGSFKDSFTSNENVIGTPKVLVTAKNTGIKKIIFSSFSSVCGDGSILSKDKACPLIPNQFMHYKVDNYENQ